MPMRVARIFFAILPFLSGFVACKKVVQVDLNNAAPQIVIEGEVTDMPGPYQVKISKTVPFGSGNNFPPVNGAIVRITDSTTGFTSALLENDSSGIYRTNAFVGQHGHTYLLSVNSEGMSYAASSAMPAAVRLDSVNFVRNLDLNNKPAINAVANFQDPPGPGNKYQFTEFVNGVQVPQIFVFEDRLSDGRYIRNTLYNDTVRLHQNDTVLVRMNCIDRNIYDYFFTLLQISGNGNFQSASPANPNSNLSNGALGYFSAHTVSQKSLVVY
ncbi:MAG: DUF4249 domain-containing protein [Bacteroidota bacterium]|nr:DUF4249 domain-containing protein [Bacteroidota bacterium]MDP4214573.1 DUF4249 domain-containing protein [Bacteroidota bacterium]MDP4245626.1 DUF4249 domain-containing protein [Bacteroidota bacterium]MDP4255725.1 DUF4249 domain-containing protein [Bacteroidota bacterium]MDP4257876.1 DUF4249 domain-containing protein [Bacteroidota bacterium]